MLKVTGTPGPIDIDGYLMLWYIEEDFPVTILKRDDSSHRLLPIFTTLDKLEAAKKWIKPPNATKIKKIDDGIEFLDSLNGSLIIVAVDPWITSEGNTRFTAVLIDD